jgi:hypothetical protein
MGSLNSADFKAQALTTEGANPDDKNRQSIMSGSSKSFNYSRFKERQLVKKVENALKSFELNSGGLNG